MKTNYDARVLAFIKAVEQHEPPAVQRAFHSELEKVSSIGEVSLSSILERVRKSDKRSAVREKAMLANAAHHCNS
jgi:hypothetical protein